MKMHLVDSCWDCYFSDGNFCVQLYEIGKSKSVKGLLSKDGKILKNCPLPNYPKKGIK